MAGSTTTFVTFSGCLQALCLYTDLYFVAWMRRSQKVLSVRRAFQSTLDRRFFFLSYIVGKCPGVLLGYIGYTILAVPSYS